MGLITCPDCGREISEHAEYCPNCGCPKSFFNNTIHASYIGSSTSKVGIDWLEDKLHTKNNNVTFSYRPYYLKYAGHGFYDEHFTEIGYIDNNHLYHSLFFDLNERCNETLITSTGTFLLKIDGTLRVDQEFECNYLNFNSEMKDWNDIKSIVGIGYQVLGLKKSGEVLRTDKSEYTEVDNWKSIKQIAINRFAAFGIDENNTVKVASDNQNFLKAKSWRNIKDIVAGKDYVIGLTYDGTIRTAVNDAKNDDDKDTIASLLALEDESITDVVAISGTATNIVLLNKKGLVSVYGDNSNNQCDISEWSDIVAITAIDGITLGIDSKGIVHSTSGKFGNIDNVISIEAFNESVCTLSKDGKVEIWGNTSYVNQDISRESKYSNLSDVRKWKNITKIDKCGEGLIGLRSNNTLMFSKATGIESYIENVQDYCFTSYGRNVIALTTDGRLESTDDDWNEIDQFRCARGIKSIASGFNYVFVVQEDGTVCKIVKDSERSDNEEEYDVEDWTDIVRIEKVGSVLVGYTCSNEIYITGKIAESVIKEHYQNVKKVVCGYNSVFILKNNGKIVYSFYGENKEEEEKNYSFIKEWGEVADIEASETGIVGITGAGEILLAGRFYQTEFDIFESWKNISKIRYDDYDSGWIAFTNDGKVLVTKPAILWPTAYKAFNWKINNEAFVV